jgi:nucleoside-diphosphate-sugar epimerase
LADRRILVVGGSGVIGRSLVPVLVAGGHRVTVLARRDETARLAEAMGARPARGDIFAPDTLRDAAADQDAIVHLATRIPRAFPGRPDDFAENDRIRREGTMHLLAAAEAAGVARVVLQSIIWVHGDHGETWLDEDSALKPGRLTQSAVDLESQGRAFAQRTGAATSVLRCGSLYSAGAWHTQEIVRRLRGRILPIVAGGRNFQGFVHVDDAAAAFAAAALAAGAGGTLLVTDDEPVRMSDYLNWLAQAAGASRPLHVPAFVARLALGSDMEAAYGASVRCRNARAKAQLGWQPRYPSFREGYPEVLAKLGRTDSLY